MGWAVLMGLGGGFVTVLFFGYWARGLRSAPARADPGSGTGADRAGIGRRATPARAVGGEDRVVRVDVCPAGDCRDRECPCRASRTDARPSGRRGRSCSRIRIAGGPCIVAVDLIVRGSMWLALSGFVAAHWGFRHAGSTAHGRWPLTAYWVGAALALAHTLAAFRWHYDWSPHASGHGDGRADRRGLWPELGWRRVGQLRLSRRVAGGRGVADGASSTVRGCVDRNVGAPGLLLHHHRQRRNHVRGVADEPCRYRAGCPVGLVLAANCRRPIAECPGPYPCAVPEAPPCRIEPIGVV